DLDTNSIVIKESMVDKFASSEILSATLSKYISDSEDVMLPLESTYEVGMVQGETQNVMHHSEENNELQSILFTLIDVFGTDPLNTGEKSVVIQDIKTDNLILNLETKKKIKESKVLQATLSHYITDKASSGLIIPADDTIIESMAIIGYDGLKNIIMANELENLIDAAFHLFGKEDTLKVNEIISEHIMIDKEAIEHITISKIFNTTIMDSLLKEKDLVIPVVEGKITAVPQLLNPDSICIDVDKNEIKYLLTALIDTIGTDGKIDTSAIQISHIHLTDGLDLSRSEILSATLGNKILSTSDFEIPSDCIRTNVLIHSLDNTNETKDLIYTTDLSQLFDSIFCLVDELNINSGQSDLNMDDIVFTKDN
ncbi:MAG: hypothetical protein K2H02_06450, partial [Anaeroplasmataceae bacterium]|nr:hypothetical protein [Anaeroplasmataceae bacterium]